MAETLTRPVSTVPVIEVAATGTAEARALNAEDRCDRCGAQAYLLLATKSGFELLFCAHHGRAHRDKLEEDGATVLVDNSDVLHGEKRSQGAAHA